jgi:hypothetical protein
MNAIVPGDGQGGPDVEVATAAAAGGYAGVWVSRYEYFSSGRDAMHADERYVVVLQHGDRLTVRSLGGGSTMTMDLTADGSVLTGTWVEQTDPAGYYRGARYHGAIQLLAEPTGRRLRGKWIGFGKNLEVNSGPWSLTFQDASTSRSTLARYSE